MLKHGIWMVVASVLAIFLKTQLAKVLHYLLLAHNKVADWLGLVFSHGSIGQLILDVLALMIIPIVIGLLVAIVLMLMKRTAKPQALVATWTAWVVLLVTLLAQVV